MDGVTLSRIYPVYLYCLSRVKHALGLGPEKSGLIELELTTRCNRNCLYCPRHVIPSVRKLGDITPEVVDTIVHRLGEYRRPFSVNFVGFGEQLLYDGFFDVLDRIKPVVTRGVIDLTTNGTLLDEGVGDRIMDSGLHQICISVNVPTKELGDKYHKDNSYELVVNNVTEFLRKKKGRPPKTLIRMLKTQESLPYLEEARKFWKKHMYPNDYFHVSLISNWAGFIDEKIFGQEYGKQVDRVCRRLVRSYGFDVSKEGDVFPCCNGAVFPSEHSSCLGNLADHSFEELLMKKRAITHGFPDCAICSENLYYIDPETGEHVKGMVKTKDYAEG